MSLPTTTFTAFRSAKTSNMRSRPRQDIAYSPTGSGASSSVEPPEEVDPTQFYFAMSLLTWAYWVLFSMLGGLAGSLITFDITGIDFALTALFVVLFIEQVIKRENRPAGFMGLACSVVGLAVFGTDNMVIPAMVLTLIALLLGRKTLCA